MTSFINIGLHLGVLITHTNTILIHFQTDHNNR